MVEWVVTNWFFFWGYGGVCKTSMATINYYNIVKNPRVGR